MLGVSPSCGYANGVVAQLGERLNGIQEVAGSIPVSSTKNKGLTDKRLAPLRFL